MDASSKCQVAMQKFVGAAITNGDAKTIAKVILGIACKIHAMSAALGAFEIFFVLGNGCGLAHGSAILRNDARAGQLFGS